MSANVIPFPSAKPCLPESNPVSFFDTPVEKYIDIRPIENAAPGDEFFGCRLDGGSLSGDGIFDGDFATFRKISDLCVIKPGTLIAVLTPDGLLIQHAYLGIGTIRLVASNPQYKDRTYLLSDVEIVGTIVRVERDFQ
jgi:SOS-response transcriptional repressor LexA